MWKKNINIRACFDLYSIESHSRMSRWVYRKWYKIKYIMKNIVELLTKCSVIWYGKRIK